MKAEKRRRCAIYNISCSTWLEGRYRDMNTYDLATQYDSRNSFYGKARIIETEKETQLWSYDTHVATMTTVGGTTEVKVFGTYSNTTLRHIKEFLLQNGFKAVNKAQIVKDYVK